MSKATEILEKYSDVNEAGGPYQALIKELKLYKYAPPTIRGITAALTDMDKGTDEQEAIDAHVPNFKDHPKWDADYFGFFSDKGLGDN